MFSLKIHLFNSAGNIRNLITVVDFIAERSHFNALTLNSNCLVCTILVTDQDIDITWLKMSMLNNGMSDRQGNERIGFDSKFLKKEFPCGRRENPSKDLFLFLFGYIVVVAIYMVPIQLKPLARVNSRAGLEVHGIERNGRKGQKLLHF